MPKTYTGLTTTAGPPPIRVPVFGGDLGGFSGDQVVQRINGVTVPAGGALVSGRLLTTTGPAAADWLAPGGGSDPLRPSATQVLTTTDNVLTTMTGLTLALPDAATIEVAVLVVADSASDGRTFYRHMTFRRAGGAPTSLAYTSPQDNDAGSAGASAWTVTVTTSGNNVIVQVQNPGGGSTTWTGEIQLTIGYTL